MKVKVNDTAVDIDKDSLGLEGMYQAIESVLAKQGMVFDHFEVDGVELYDDYDAFFKEHWNEIQDVVVVSQSIDQLVEGTLVTTHEYLGRALPLMESIANDLYCGPNERVWKEFIQMLDGFQWLIESAKLFATHYPSIPDFQGFEAELGPKIAELGNAMENSDCVLMADLLSYEILPKLKRFDEEIAKLTTEDGESEYVN